MVELMQAELALGPEAVLGELWGRQGGMADWNVSLLGKRVVRRVGLQTLITHTTVKDMLAGVLTARLPEPSPGTALRQHQPSELAL